MSKFYVVMILMTMLTSAVMASGQPETPNVAWLHTAGFGLAHLHDYPYDNDWANGMAFDSSGYVYVAGASNSFLYNDTNAVLVKLNANGQLQWATVWHGDGVGMRAAVDSRGNAFLVGTLGNAWVQQGAFLAQFGPDGGLEWNSVWGPPLTPNVGGDYVHSIYVQGLTIDTYGDAFVSGTVSYPPEYAFLVKFNPAGDLDWSRVWTYANMSDGCFGGPGPGCFGASSVALDAVGNVDVAGYAGNDTFLARFSSNGELQWSRVLGEDKRQLGMIAITLDAMGNIYGVADSIIWQEGGACTGAWQASSGEVLLAKFAPNGSAYWVKTLETPAEPDYFLSGADGVAVDSGGDVYVVGARNAPYWANGSDMVGRSDVFVAKFASDGKLYWDVGALAQTGCTICYCGRLVTPVGIAVDPAGDIYVGGTTYNNRLETYPPPAKLNAVLADANVTTRDLPPIIHDDLGFVVEHPASEVLRANITIDGPPPDNASYSRMIVMKLQQYGAPPATVTTTVRATVTMTSTELQRPDLTSQTIVVGISVAVGIAAGSGVALMIGRHRSAARREE
jgi:hypothetical protein